MDVAMLRPVTLGLADLDELLRVVNDAARAYRGAIPPDCYQEPYLTADELRRELGEIQFYGWLEAGRLVGVMGVQEVLDVTLVRHAYVEQAHQRRGIGSRLLQQVESVAGHPTILVGTWADAGWAIAFYRQHGYELVADRAETEALLRRYWRVPDRQIEASVVLRKVRSGPGIHAPGQ